jgi:hypothetical protein
MNKLSTCLRVLSVAACVSLAACSAGRILLNARVADTADYSLNSIQILQPPAQPGAGDVTVRIAYDLAATGGNVSPIVWLFDDDGFLRFADDVVAKGNFVEGAGNLAPGSYDGMFTFSLSCDDDEVVGPLDGTGEGHKELFGNINEAEIRAAAQRPGDASNPIVVSDAVDLWCEE